MSKQTLRKAHRWLGLLFSVSILMAAGSGVIHNVMTRTQPPPPPALPTGTLDASLIRLGVAEAVEKLPGEARAVTAVNVRGIGGSPWYQVYSQNGGAAHYVSAVDGRVDPGQDEAYAAEIASRFLAGAAVRKTARLTAFDSEYLNIFRILPVYRFDLDDERRTRVYVSTATGSVTRHTDDGRQLEARIFTNFHKLGFIPDKNTRDLVLTALTTATCIVALLGVALFFATMPRKKNRPQA